MKSQLVVIAGHGGTDPGTSSGALVEREVNIEAVLAFNDVVHRDYVVDARHRNLIITRKGESALGGEALLADRIRTVNAEFGSDVVVIDVHHNAETTGHGALIYYSQNAATTPGDESMIIAPLIAEELAKVVGESVPLIVSSRSRFGGLGITDNTLGSALLVEMRKTSAANTFAARYAEGAALARALARYFGWPRVNVTPAPPARDRAVVLGEIRARLDELERIS